MTRFQSIMLCFAVGMLALPDLHAEDHELTFNAAPRLWRDTSGKHTINAALVKYHDRQLTLLIDDGKTIKVPLEKLGTTDRVYLARQRRLLRSQPTMRTVDVSVSGATPSTQTLGNLATPVTSGSANQSRPDSESLFGVDWHSPASAQSIAAKESKPVMWFRVLGDLSGFM